MPPYLPPGLTYRDGSLALEEVDLAALAETAGTPAFCYSSAVLESTYDALSRAVSDRQVLICYALKANSTLGIVRTLAGLGAGADVVSEGELRQALAAGIPPDKVVFAGVGKTPRELAAALDAGILQFNVESSAELFLLNRVASEKGLQAPVALRINPNVDARTHAKISTGKAENKFGIDIAEARRLLGLAHELQAVAFVGLAIHIGSQITELEPYRDAFERLVELYAEQRARGLQLERIDLGGGIGIRYGAEEGLDLEAYGELLRRATRGLDARVVIEPGRFLVGNAGLLLTRVLYVKQGVERVFAVVDAAMNDLIRPTLYDAWHEFRRVREPGGNEGEAMVDIVGPVCETGDTFARQRGMPPLQAGDLLAVLTAGAYGSVMASNYNLRLRPPEILIRGATHAVVRPREAYEELLGKDRLAPWQEDEATGIRTGMAG